MSPMSENDNTKATEPDNVATSVVHNGLSPELDNVNTSPAQVDSSPDNTSPAEVESRQAIIPSPSNANVAKVTAPTTTVSKSRVTTATSATAATAATTNTDEDASNDEDVNNGEDTNNDENANNDENVNNDENAKRLIMSNRTLSYSSIDAALGDGLMGRVPMEIKDDDVADVKHANNSQAWVTKLVSAFCTDYLTTPEDTTKDSPAQQDWFKRWQKTAHASIVQIANTKGLDYVEKSCWHLFGAVIKAHELGYVDAGTALKPSKVKCSARLEFIAGVLEKYARVRLDVLTAWHIDEIAANPEQFIKRKLVNCWNNGNRAVTLKTVKERKEADKEADKVEKEKVAKKEKAAAKKEKTAAKKGAAQTPAKGKKASKIDEQAEEQTAVKGKEVLESTAGDAIDNGAEEGDGVEADDGAKLANSANDNGATNHDKRDTNTNTGTKRPYSAMTSDSDDKESTPNKRPAVAVKSSSSSDEVKNFADGELDLGDDN